MQGSSSNDGGFTLVELLVVVTMVGVLATVVTFSLAGLGDASSHATCGNEAAALRAAEDAAIANEGHFLTRAQLLAGKYLEDAVSAYDVEATSDGGYRLVEVGSCSLELAGGGGSGGGTVTTSPTTTSTTSTTTTSTTTTTTSTTSTTSTTTTTTAPANLVITSRSLSTHGQSATVQVRGTGADAGTVTVTVYSSNNSCTQGSSAGTGTASGPGDWTTGDIGLTKKKTYVAVATQGGRTSNAFCFDT